MENMNIDALIQRIWKIVRDEKSPKYPRIVNIMTPGDMQYFRQQFDTPAITEWNVSRYCENDDDPALDRLWDNLSHASKGEIIFLYRFTSLLKLQGNQRLEQFFKNFLSISRNGSTVLVAYQCRPLLETISEPKFKRLIYTVQGIVTPEPSVILRSPDLPKVSGIQGLSKLPNMLEETDENHFLVITRRTITDYPNSILRLKD